MSAQGDGRLLTRRDKSSGRSDAFFVWQKIKGGSVDAKGLLFAAFALICLLVTGCGANRHAMYRHEKLDREKGAVITVDAKQRHLIISPEIIAKYASMDGSTAFTRKSIQRFCAEPSPDVFSVVAQSLSASGTFGKRPDPKAIEVALTAAFSSAEQGSTIPRTQTVNMLRELMYRTCERYLNGGISSLELSVQAARDQRLMVSILAIESLTGTVTPKPVVIGASSNSEAGNKTGSGAEAAVRLDDAYKELKAKQATMAERQAQYNAANGVDATPGVCDGIRAALAKKEDLTDDQKKKVDDCTAKWNALVEAKDAFGSARTHYDRLSLAASSGGAPSAASEANVMTPKADGGINRAHSESISSVAKTVETIVIQNLAQDEFAFFCIKYMSPNAKDNFSSLIIQDDATQKKCLEYFRSQLDVEISRNKSISQSMVIDIRDKETSSSDRHFEKFWQFVSKDRDEMDKNLFEKYRLIYQKRHGQAWPKRLIFIAGKKKEKYRDDFVGNDMDATIRENLSRIGE